MGKFEKLLLQILRRTSDTNISFNELCNVLLHLSFEERIKGYHHIFRKVGVEEKNKSTKGESYEKALANAKDAISHWIETAKEFGDPISLVKIL